MRLITWNKNTKIQKNKDVVSQAKKGDFLFSYKGYYFLCQRTADINNIVWAKTNKPKTSVTKAFEVYRKKLIKKHIQYCQVTTEYRLKFFAYMHIFKKMGLDFVFDISADSPRYCLVIKLY